MFNRRNLRPVRASKSWVIPGKSIERQAGLLAVGFVEQRQDLLEKKIAGSIYLQEYNCDVYRNVRPPEGNIVAR